MPASEQHAPERRPKWGLAKSPDTQEQRRGGDFRARPAELAVQRIDPHRKTVAGQRHRPATRPEGGGEDHRPGAGELCSPGERHAATGPSTVSSWAHRPDGKQRDAEMAVTNLVGLSIVLVLIVGASNAMFVYGALVIDA